MEAKIWNFNKWIKETDPEELNRVFDAMIAQAGFSVLGVLTYHFTPQGYTKIYLLAESHFAVHTFPEHNLTYIELSSCNKLMQERFLQLFRIYAGE